MLVARSQGYKETFMLNLTELIHVKMCLFVLMLHLQINNFLVMSRCVCLPGLRQYQAEDKVSS